MTVNRHKYFRWTKRTAWLTFAYVVLVPGMLGTAGYMTEVSLGKHASGRGGIAAFETLCTWKARRMDADKDF